MQTRAKDKAVAVVVRTAPQLAEGSAGHRALTSIGGRVVKPYQTGDYDGTIRVMPSHVLMVVLLLGL